MPSHPLQISGGLHWRNSIPKEIDDNKTQKDVAQVLSVLLIIIMI